MNSWTHERAKPRQWAGEPILWYQPKRDGNRITFFMQQNGTLHTYGRKIDAHSRLDSALHRYKWYKNIKARLKPRSSLDCELYSLGNPASYVRSALATAHKINLINSDEPLPQLQIAVFALPWWSSVYMGNVPLPEIDKLLKSLHITPEPTREYHGESAAELLRRAKEYRLEGYVLKMQHYFRAELGEPCAWFKIKVTHTVDCVVVGTTPGEGKYSGQVGALIVALGSMSESTAHMEHYQIGQHRFIEVANVSGFTDAERKRITMMGDNVDYRVCEVEYQSVLSRGRLQHPRFVRWREDKYPHECLMDQLPNVTMEQYNIQEEI